MGSLSFFFGFIISKSFLHPKNSDDFFKKKLISRMKFLLLVLAGVPVVCFSGDAIKNLVEHRWCWLGLGLPKLRLVWPVGFVWIFLLVLWLL